MLDLFWSFIAFIITFGLLVTVHELGHFWAARLCGVAVERFSIGFGYPLWRKRDKLGTEYIIAAIPIGGYVKMLDDKTDIIAPEYRHTAFNYKNFWQRSLIILAGPIFNFLFAIFSYWLVFITGVSSYRPVIGEVIPYSIAAKAELSPNMEIKSINNVETPDWDSVRLQLIDKIGYKEVVLGLSLFDSNKFEQKTLNLNNILFEPNKQDLITAIGILPLGPKTEPVLAEIYPNSIAMQAGLQVGDRIVKVNGQQIATWPLFLNLICNSSGELIHISIDRQGEIKNLILQLSNRILKQNQVEKIIGIAPRTVQLPSKYLILQRYSLFSALIHAIKKTWQLMQVTANMFGKLITGYISIKSLSGPLSIAHNAVISVEHGLIYYLMFLSLISINLGIINLFPLPILDGGHLFFLIIEIIQGKPISKRIQDFIYLVGSVLIIFCMGLALFNDFSRL